MESSQKTETVTKTITVLALSERECEAIRALIGPISLPMLQGKAAFPVWSDKDISLITGINLGEEFHRLGDDDNDVLFQLYDACRSPEDKF